MKKLFFALGACACIPHILFFVLRKNTNDGKKLSKDIKVWLSRKNHSDYGQIKGMAYLLLKLKEFRNLYYHRMGKGTLLFSWVLPRRDTLHLFTPSERIGGGFYIGHGWGTVVNAYSIGEECLVAQNTTIGSKDLKTPILGNHVSVWSHCVIIGGGWILEITHRLDLVPLLLKMYQRIVWLYLLNQPSSRKMANE